jgi:ubiquinone/menaquinone biosynthesis C-methylase UbiE
MFSEIAEYYDHFKRHRDYELEANVIDGLINKFGTQPIKSIIELACGTGSLVHELTNKGYSVDGLDNSKQMLEIAKTKVGVTSNFIRANFTSYNPDAAYDGVVLLDGAIGYVRPEQITTTIRNITRNILSNSGVLIIEPWYSENDWNPNTNHLVTYEADNGDKYVRMSHSEKDGFIEFHHLIANQSGIQYIVGWHQVLSP